MRTRAHTDAPVTARTHVIVIGGGFAGVAAAAALRARGATVTLIDERATLGGRARSDELAGVTIDTGSQLIATSFTRTLRLLGGARAIADRDETRDDPPGFAADAHVLRRTPGRDLYVHRGARHPVQFGSIRSLLAFGGLGALDKLRLARHLLPMLALHRAQLDADAARLPPSLDAESARAFIATRIGEDAADILAEPPLNGFYAVRAEEASLAFYLTIAHYGSDADVLAPLHGWSRALDAALDGVHREREARVETLSVARDGGVLAAAANGATWRADGCVIATGAVSARALLMPLLAPEDPLLAWLASVELRPTWTVALALDRPLPSEVFGIFPHARDARLVSACAVQSAKTGRAEERGVVLAWPTPDAVARLNGEGAEQITTAMIAEIEALVPAARGHIARARVYRFPEGSPVARPGFAAHRARGRSFAAGLRPPVALAGDYLTTPIIEGAVASGELAAAQLADRLGLT